MLLLLLALAAPASTGLRCTSAGDRIEIALPADMDPSLTALAVVRGGRWATLVDETHALAPFVPGTRRLVLRPSRQLAVAYDRDGQERRVRAFPRPGAYRILFSDNLETEPENMTMLDCIVRVGRIAPVANRSGVR